MANKVCSYSWRYGEEENFNENVPIDGPSQPLAEGSMREFITEHYWGYAKQRDSSTMEYRVDHRWNVWDAKKFEFHCQVTDLYGEQFAPFLSATGFGISRGRLRSESTGGLNS